MTSGAPSWPRSTPVENVQATCSLPTLSALICLSCRVAVIGVIARRHDPFFGVLRHLDQFVIGVGGPCGEDRRSAKTSCKQEIAHRESSLRYRRGLTDARPQRAARRHPFHGKSFRQRVTASARHRGTPVPRLSLRKKRQRSRLTDALEAGNRTKSTLAFFGPQQQKQCSNLLVGRESLLRWRAVLRHEP